MLYFVLAGQILILVLTSATGRRGEVWLNLIVALAPALLILFALGLHWGNYEVMPLTHSGSRRASRSSRGLRS